MPFPEPDARRFWDPLFTVDLSNPTDLKVLGELEIPGFSSYLHLVGEDHLIGLGRDADPRTGRVRQLQVSLFDVSDLAQPVLAYRYDFDLPSWARTEAIEDHHAVAYYPKHQILALPVTNGERGTRRRTNLYVFQIDLPAGGNPAQITLLGQVEHNSPVRRSVRIEDYIFSISENSVKVQPILDPVREVAYLRLDQPLSDATSPFRPGDTNVDGIFGQLDIVRVLQGAKYMTGEAADWSEGDWNVDGVFDQLDLVLALQEGDYTRGGVRK